MGGTQSGQGGTGESRRQETCYEESSEKGSAGKGHKEDGCQAPTEKGYACRSGWGGSRRSVRHLCGHFRRRVLLYAAWWCSHWRIEEEESLGLMQMAGIRFSA
jgi:hypothetical protein